MRLQRHDRAWLASDFEPRHGLCDVRLAAAAGAWIRASRPLVVANQRGVDTAQIRLGFTVPGADARQRVGLLVPRATIVRAERALCLTETIDRAPPDWRALMRSVASLSAECGVTSRVFGSLAAQLASGEPCLKPSSDIDVLFECGADTRLDDLLAGLRELGDGFPRVDGEVLLASGWAIAWRELSRARAAGKSAKVLARSVGDLRLMSLGQLSAFAQAA